MLRLEIQNSKIYSNQNLLNKGKKFDLIKKYTNLILQDYTTDNELNKLAYIKLQNILDTEGDEYSDLKSSGRNENKGYFSCLIGEN